MYLNRNFIIYQVLFNQIQRENVSRRDFKRKREERRQINTQRERNKLGDNNWTSLSPPHKSTVSTIHHK